MKASHRVRIYKSHWHLLITFGFIILPFIFILVFSQLGHIPTKQLFLDIGVSVLRLSVAYMIAAVLAWILAIIFYRGARAAIALPFFDVLQSFPTFAVLPLVTYFWGPSNVTIVFFLVLTVIWPILFSILSSLKLIRNDWEEAIQISGLKGFQYVKIFLWPVSIPGLITGSIIGLGEGWESLIATEIITNNQLGLGNFFQTFSQNISVTAFGILGFLLLIFSLNKLLWLPLLDWSHRMTNE